MKRICFICFFVILSVFLAYVGTPDFDVIETMAVPVSNKVIVLDAGHGSPDERC